MNADRIPRLPGGRGPSRYNRPLRAAIV
jgi:hypothetical protein